MAIKAWPYGRKPGIAVAKETKSRLLTVWPLKLWGAAAPVAQKIKKSVQNIFWTKQGERNNQCHSVLSSQKSSHCPIVGVRDSLIDLHSQRGTALFEHAGCQQDSKTSTFIYELFALAATS